MIRRHAISFQHAFDGVWHAIITQPNFRIHLLAATTAIVCGLKFSISTTEWLILTLVITGVIVVELINTSIEAVVDLLTQQHNHYAKIAKDVAAAAVLMSAIGSVIIGLIIFIPKII